jgi:hypothetical protein
MTEAKRPVATAIIKISLSESDIFQKAISIIIQKRRGFFNAESVPEHTPGIAKGNLVYIITTDDPFNFFELGKLFGENLHF